MKTPEHDTFLVAYQKRWQEYPRLGSVVGCSSVMSLAAVRLMVFVQLRIAPKTPKPQDAN
jgi:hypothetical protein